MMVVPGTVVTGADPLPSTHAKMPRGRTAFTLIVPLSVGYGCIAGPRRTCQVSGMSEQAVLGGVIRDTSGRHDVIVPRSIDGGVSIAAVVRLDGGRFVPARGYGRARYRLRSHLPGPAVEYERLYCVVARGAGHINCGVRRRNRGVAAGLYSQAPLLPPVGIGCHC